MWEPTGNFAALLKYVLSEGGIIGPRAADKGLAGAVVTPLVCAISRFEAQGN